MNRILSCPVPESISPLSPNGFKFSINRIPELTYFCQEAPIPRVSLPPITIGNVFIPYPVSGETMQFEDLEIEFLVDNSMTNYIALFNWLRGLGFPENNLQYSEQIQDGTNYNLSEVASSTSDATLSILGNTNNVIQNIVFTDCVITSLSGLRFQSTNNSVTYLVGTATFSYAYYDFI